MLIIDEVVSPKVLKYTKFSVLNFFISEKEFYREIVHSNY